MTEQQIELLKRVNKDLNDLFDRHVAWRDAHGEYAAHEGAAVFLMGLCTVMGKTIKTYVPEEQQAPCVLSMILPALYQNLK